MNNQKTVRGGLVRNECIKIRRQTGLRVVFIVILVICLLEPLLFKAVDVFANSYIFSSNLQDRYEFYLEDAKAYREAAKELSADSQRHMLLSAEYYDAYAEALGYFIDNNTPEWKQAYYLDIYCSHVLKQRAAELMVSGEYSPQEVYDSMFGGSLSDQDKFTAAVCVLSDTNEVLFLAEQDGVDTEIDSIQFYDYVKLESDAVREYLAKAEFTDELAVWYAMAQANVAQCRAQAAELKQQTEQHPDDSRIRFRYEGAMLSVEGYTALAKGYRWLYDNAAEYGSWQINAVKEGMARATAALADTAVYDRAGFEDSVEADYYSSYEQYVDEKQSAQESARQALAIFDYSLEHNIPVSGELTDTAKGDTNQCIAMSAGLVLIYMIILAGTTLSGEFSSGSVRLLLIRPKKRRKILTAKIVSVLASTALLVALATVGQLAINIIFNGVSDTFTPDLYYIGGRVVELPGIVRSAQILVYSLLPALLAASLALLLSCLTSRSALAIAVPLVLNAILGTASSISLAMRSFAPMLDYTILPYYSMTAFVNDPLVLYLSDSVGLTGIGTLASASGLHAWVGLAMFGFGVVLTVALSYLSFIKRQIKS